MIHLQPAGNEVIPGLQCDLCGRIVSWDSMLRAGEALTAGDLDAMRLAAEQRYGWRHLTYWIPDPNGHKIPAANCDLCGATVVLKPTGCAVVDLVAAGWRNLRLAGHPHGRDLCPKCWASLFERATADS